MFVKGNKQWNRNNALVPSHKAAAASVRNCCCTCAVQQTGNSSPGRARHSLRRRPQPHPDQRRLLTLPPPPHSTPTRPIVALRPVWRVSASQQALSDVPVYTHTPVTLHCGQFTSLDSTTRPAEKSKKGKFHWLHPVIAGNEIRVGCPRNTESCHCLFV